MPISISAHDVARELRSRVPGAGILKIHKMLYYSQAWYLAWHGERLFVEDLQAWDNGPVVATLWHDEDKDRVAPAPTELDDAQITVVDYVVSRYGSLSGRDLIELTHSEQPWKQAFSVAKNYGITDEALTRFFSSDWDDEGNVRTGRSSAEYRNLARLASVAAGGMASPLPDDTLELQQMLAALAS